MAAPLAGIRVVEVANWLAAPSAAAMMRDLGADVIKVEPPDGDAYRGVLQGLELDHNYPSSWTTAASDRSRWRSTSRARRNSCAAWRARRTSSSPIWCSRDGSASA
jgi:crotonobetainyl-CoA:carnitine CoA-transferase CaiB-like acyl-CoA transferase